MRKALLLFFIFGSLLPLSGQRNRSIPGFRDMNGRDNRAVYGQIEYYIPTASNINTGGFGWNFSGGINLAFPFSKKWSVGVFAGLKIKELFFTPGAFNSRYTLDFVNSIHPEYASGHDSLLISFIAGNISSRGSAGGCSGGQYGIYIHYPKRYLPLVKIYRCGISDAIYGYQYDGVYGYDYIYISSLNIGISGTWSVLNFDSGGKITASAFFVRGKFDSMQVDGLWMDDYVDPAFAERYSHLWRAGITIGIGYY